MSSRMLFNHIGHCVRDLEAARRFYTELLGFEFLREIHPADTPTDKLLGLDGPLDMTACYLRLDGFVLELLSFAAPKRTKPSARRTVDEPGLTHLSIACDIDAVCARVEEFGGTVEHDTNIGNAVFIRDPDGQFIELLPLAYADAVRDRS